MGESTLDQQQFLEVGLEPHIRFRSPSYETVRGMVANGLGFSLLISKPANNMSYEDHALVTHPIADDIGTGRVILRQPGQQVQNPHIETFAHHCQQFFAA